MSRDPPIPEDLVRHAAMYKPYHLIGLELGVSVASAALRREPTGCPDGWRADVVAVAKRDLAAGEVLDGEGGFTVWGKVLPASASLGAGSDIYANDVVQFTVSGSAASALPDRCRSAFDCTALPSAFDCTALPLCLGLESSSRVHDHRRRHDTTRSQS